MKYNTKILTKELIEKHIEKLQEAYIQTIDFYVSYDINIEYLKKKLADKDKELEENTKKMNSEKDKEKKKTLSNLRNEILDAYGRIKNQIQDTEARVEQYDLNVKLIEHTLEYYKSLLK